MDIQNKKTSMSCVNVISTGRKCIFLFGRFIACINTHLYVKFKNNLSGGSV